MPRPRRKPLFELSDYWINAIDGRPGLYYFWYEPGTGRVCRARLREQDLEAAKVELAGIVLGGKGTKKAFLSIVLENYYTQRSDKLPSKYVARSAGRIALAHFGAKARVSKLTPEAQREFILHCAQTLDHAPTTIARNMTVIATALAFAGIADVPVIYRIGEVRAAIPKPKAEARTFMPSDDELARFVASIDGPLHRAVLVMMNTLCRPEAATDLAPGQRDREAGLLSLNPDGRAQTKKFRPVIRATDCLSGWLEAWEPCERYAGIKSYGDLQEAFQEARDAAKLPELVPYSIRHKMTTVLRRSSVPEDQVSLMLGHKRPQFRTTAGYGEFDPSYLKEACAAVDAYMIRLQRLAPTAVLFSHGSLTNRTESDRVSKLSR